MYFKFPTPTTTSFTWKLGTQESIYVVISCSVVSWFPKWMEKKETTEQTQMTYEESENNIIWFGVFSMKFKKDFSSKV